MEDAMWVILSAILALAAVLLGVLLWRQQRDNQDLRAETDAASVERDSAVAAKEKAIAERKLAEAQAAEAATEASAVPADDEQRRKYVRAAQEAVNGTVRRMQGLGNDAAERIQAVLHTYGADVLADLMPVDHVVAQMQRRLQVLAVLCGSWPGQQRSPAELADIVRGAQSRIHDYARVRMSTPDEKTAVVGRVVEPIGMALAELLDNATRSSPPTTPVDVVFETDYHGVSILVVDGGVGMAPEEVRRAVALLQWGQHEVDLTELGNPPRTGFAVCGVLAARYGFRVGLDTGSPRGGLRATLFLPSALLTTVDPGEDVRAIEPPRAPVREPAMVSAPSWPVHDEEPATTVGGLPKRRRADRAERLGRLEQVGSVEPTDRGERPERFDQLDRFDRFDRLGGTSSSAGTSGNGGSERRTRTGELPALDMPSPAPRHAQYAEHPQRTEPAKQAEHPQRTDSAKQTEYTEPALATEASASNLRAFQSGARLGAEAQSSDGGAHDD